ncbi:MAG: TIGR00341 family protein [Bacteroidales bacterium]|nr:TIGR00341 family protein [Bacteroidales bacterium]
MPNQDYSKLENIIRKVRITIKHYLDLNRDKINNQQTYDAIASGIEFKGTNLWVLIFAIFVASLGLNMNSTPVIIGAMLISPLMGPIMGIGLGLGVKDLNLITRSFKNLVVATLFGMLTSCLYFLISPIDEARSELLARTTPTIYDVLIAFFGGMAGIIATGSKDKGNVIPGVAIATALMPPLCTSGYGLATGQWNFFFGAFYLYLINCVYIGFATWLGVLILKLPKEPAEDLKKRKRLVQAISFLVLITALPSIYITYKIIKDNIQTTQVNNFVNQQFEFQSTQVLSRQIVIKDKNKVLEVTLIGKPVPQDSINLIASKMSFYGLKDVQLKVMQGYSPDEASDQKAINSTIMQDLLKYNQDVVDRQRSEIFNLEKSLKSYQRFDSLGVKIAPEIKVIFPQVTDLAVAKTYFNEVDSLSLSPVTIAIIYTKEEFSEKEQNTLKEWLSARIETKKLHLFIEKQNP